MWLRAWRAQGHGDWSVSLLEAFEPLAPLAAQLMWVAQPGLGWWLGHERLASLARALETPEGIAVLRGVLQDTRS